LEHNRGVPLEPHSHHSTRGGTPEKNIEEEVFRGALLVFKRIEERSGDRFSRRFQVGGTLVKHFLNRKRKATSEKRSRWRSYKTKGSEKKIEMTLDKAILTPEGETDGSLEKGTSEEISRGRIK